MTVETAAPSLRGRDFISASDLSADDVARLFGRVASLKAEFRTARAHAEPPLRGRTLADHAHRCADLHGRRRTDRSAVGHGDGLGGEADQCSGRDGPLVDECDRGHLRAEQRVPDEDSGVDAAAEGVDLEDHGSGALRGGVVEHAPDEWGEAQVDDALDGRHVDDRRPRLRRHRKGRQQTEQSKGDEGGAVHGDNGTIPRRLRGTAANAP